jgi:hypothetical protein
MTLHMKNPTAGGGAGLGCMAGVSGTFKDLLTSVRMAHSVLADLREEAGASRNRRVDVRISAADGRSRLFRLSEHGFEQLVDTAIRLESRR